MPELENPMDPHPLGGRNRDWVTCTECGSDVCISAFDWSSLLDHHDPGDRATIGLVCDAESCEADFMVEVIVRDTASDDDEAAPRPGNGPA
jgi:hypothetical protein